MAYTIILRIFYITIFVILSFIKSSEKVNHRNELLLLFVKK